MFPNFKFSLGFAPLAFLLSVSGCVSDKVYEETVFATDEARLANTYFEVKTEKEQSATESCVVQGVSLSVLTDTVPKTAIVENVADQWTLRLFLAPPGGAARVDNRHKVEVARVIVHNGLISMIYKPRVGNLGVDGFGVENSLPNVISQCR